MYPGKSSSKKLAITLDDARESIILITDTQSKGIQVWKQQGAENHQAEEAVAAAVHIPDNQLDPSADLSMAAQGPSGSGEWELCLTGPLLWQCTGHTGERGHGK